MNPIQLLRNQQADNRAMFAQSQARARQAEDSSALTGRILGGNADTGQTMVQLDRGDVIPCRSITNGALKGNAIVSLSGSTAWIDGMPG